MMTNDLFRLPLSIEFEGCTFTPMVYPIHGKMYEIEYKLWHIDKDSKHYDPNAKKLMWYNPFLPDHPTFQWNNWLTLHRFNEDFEFSKAVDYVLNSLNQNKLITLKSDNT